MNRPKTIFCDIDGTLITHRLPGDIARGKIKILTETPQTLLDWDRNGYNIILTTGRKESLRRFTEKSLNDAGIIYDKLIMGIGGGDRVLINDKKSDGRVTAWAITPDRNEGLSGINFENLCQLANDYFNIWSQKDIDSLSYMLSEDVILKDWNIECSGKKEVLKANKNIFDNVESLSIIIHELSHHNNTVFCQITVVADNEEIPVVDVIKFDKDSKIESITAYRGN